VAAPLNTEHTHRQTANSNGQMHMYNTLSVSTYKWHTFIFYKQNQSSRKQSNHTNGLQICLLS